jgi:hypothetical protein
VLEKADELGDRLFVLISELRGINTAVVDILLAAFYDPV